MRKQLALSTIILWLVEAGKWTKEDARALEHVAKAQVPVIL
jgi:GTP-binding protein Era